MNNKIKSIALLLSLSLTTSSFAVNYADAASKAWKVAKIGTYLAGTLATAYMGAGAVYDLGNMICETGDYEYDIDDENTLKAKSLGALASWIWGFSAFALANNMHKEIRCFNNPQFPFD